MLTHLIKSINWVDAALVFLFIRMIFVGIKNGFISEFFKFLGVVAAVFGRVGSWENKFFLGLLEFGNICGSLVCRDVLFQIV